jgi:hypothetical protein
VLTLELIGVLAEGDADNFFMALLSGDGSRASVLVGVVFADNGSRAVCRGGVEPFPSEEFVVGDDSLFPLEERAVGLRFSISAINVFCIPFGKCIMRLMCVLR